jgi:hypothetical protein
MSDDTLSPEAYEQLTGIPEADYERRLLAAARRQAELSWVDDATIDDVRIEVGGAAVHLVVAFRHQRHPGARYGWRLPVWPAPAPNDPVVGTPEDRGTYWLSVELEETIEAGPGLPPPTPDSSGTTWL